jgi:signal transduction histidine kinase
MIAPRLSAALSRLISCVGPARDPDGGWLEYPFPKPGEEQPSRKITYMLAVPGTPYVVGAGVYADAAAPGK